MGEERRRGASHAAARPSKPCAVCGRPFAWRRRWAAVWDEVRVCSERCRRAGRSRRDDPVEAAILDLLAGRSPGATACPSEVARQLGGEAWRDHLDAVRGAAGRLVAQGLIEVTQAGRPVELAAARGPIRLRRVLHTEGVRPDGSPAPPAEA